VQTFTLRPVYVVVFVGHERRRIVHFNVTRHPNAAWIWRQLLEATPYGQQPRFLIRDRDRSHGGDFVPKAARIGIETVLTPVRAPNANAIAERVIGTLRRECLDHVIVVDLGGAQSFAAGRRSASDQHATVVEARRRVEPARRGRVARRREYPRRRVVQQPPSATSGASCRSPPTTRARPSARRVAL
jgi:transposase InsO family protein